MRSDNREIVLPTSMRRHVTPMRSDADCRRHAPERQAFMRIARFLNRPIKPNLHADYRLHAGSDLTHKEGVSA